jgi:FSR family fosmidomycin resistance protein-like MFS transporter
MTALAAGHMIADTCQGAVPALLPFLIAGRGYTYASASLLVLAATVSSSVVQPLFGFYSDRRPLPWLMPLGLLTGGVGIGLVGLAPSYPLTFAAILLSGLGVAAFHPEGSRFASYVSGERRAHGMSLFSLGGNVGFALGPLLVTPAVLLFGLSGTLLLIAPVTAVAVILARELPRLQRLRDVRIAGSGARAAAADRWGAFVRLGLVIACRSFVYFGLLTFVPLYFIRVGHDSKATGDAALTIMLAGGALGTLVGGRLADRIGRRPVLLGSMCLLPPLILAFSLARGPAAVIVVGVVGAVTISTFSVTVVIGQELLPSRIGIASGVTLGLSIGLGGFAAPLLGLLADAHGLPTTMHVIALIPLLAIVPTLTLPRGRRRGEHGVPLSGAEVDNRATV